MTCSLNFVCRDEHPEKTISAPSAVAKRRERRQRLEDPLPRSVEVGAETSVIQPKEKGLAILLTP